MPVQLGGGVATSGNPAGILFSLDCDLFQFATSAIGQGYKRGKSANFNQTPVIGAQSPFISFANCTPLELSIDIDLVAMSPSDQDDVTSLLDAFLALICPMTNGIKPPSICTVNLSGSITNNFQCLLISCQQQMATERIWNINTGEPMQAIISLTFIELAMTSIDAGNWIPSQGKTFKYA